MLPYFWVPFPPLPHLPSNCDGVSERPCAALRLLTLQSGLSYGWAARGMENTLPVRSGAGAASPAAGLEYLDRMSLDAFCGGE